MMTIREVMEIVDGKVLVGEDRLDTRVDTACGSDLMSDVLAFVKEKAVLITGLINPHVLRTSEMLDITCIVFSRGKMPSQEMLDMAVIIVVEVLDLVQLLVEVVMVEVYGTMLKHQEKMVL